MLRVWLEWRAGALRHMPKGLPHDVRLLWPEKEFSAQGRMAMPHLQSASRRVDGRGQRVDYPGHGEF